MIRPISANAGGKPSTRTFQMFHRAAGRRKPPGSRGVKLPFGSDRRHGTIHLMLRNQGLAVSVPRLSRDAPACCGPRKLICGPLRRARQVTRLRLPKVAHAISSLNPQDTSRRCEPQLPSCLGSACLAAVDHFGYVACCAIGIRSSDFQGDAHTVGGDLPEDESSRHACREGNGGQRWL